MASKFVYSKDIPAEIVKILKPLLEKYEFLVPEWAHHVRIFWNVGAQDRLTLQSGESTGDFAYRYSNIVFFSPFLEEDEVEREDTVVHELLHIPTTPLVNFYHQLLHYLDAQPDSVKGFIREQYDEKLEGVTTDLTHMVMKMCNTNQVAAQKTTGSKLPSRKKKTGRSKR